jgi:hypothetical protein
MGKKSEAEKNNPFVREGPFGALVVENGTSPKKKNYQIWQSVKI